MNRCALHFLQALLGHRSLTHTLPFAQPRPGLAYVPTDHTGVAESLAHSQEHHRVSAVPPIIQPYTLRPVSGLELSSFVPESLRTKALREEARPVESFLEKARADLVPRAWHAVFRGHLLADKGMCDSGGRVA